jgi:hypothetical protein
MTGFLVSTILCGLLSIVVILPIFPLRISLFAYLVIAHLGLSGPGFASATTMDLENALRVVILPTVLLLRTRLGGLKLVKNNPVFRLWLLFCAYVALASLWSPFKLSSIKQVGYLYTYTVGVLIFAYAFHKDRNGACRLITWSLLTALALAVVQTFIFGSVTDILSTRLKTFRGPQGFGLYLAVMFALVLSFPREQTKRNLMPKGLTILFMLFALFLNGSRTGFIAFLFIILFTVIFWPLSQRSLRRKLLPLTLSIIIIVTFAASFIAFEINPYQYQSFLQTHRSLNVLNVASEEASLEDIGTARFRLEMYQILMERLREKSIEKIAFGSGTSSAGEVIANGYYHYRGLDAYTVDANRIAHSEVFRSLYEWGFVGGGLFLLVGTSMFLGAVRIARRIRTFQAYILLGALTAISLLLMTQNILAASSAPIGSALILYLAQLASLNRDADVHDQSRKMESSVISEVAAINSLQEQFA